MNVEHFIDADQVAEMLFVTRRQVLDMARDGRLPGHPLGYRNRQRCQWRFLSSEIYEAVRNMKRPPGTESSDRIGSLGSTRSRK